jgi:dihydrofolate reductase
MNVFIIAALTADGFIGRDTGHTADWSSSDDKRLFARLTKQAGVIVMGSRTFATIGRALPDRRTIVYTSRPEAITTTGIETTTKTPHELIVQLETVGATSLAVCGGAQIYTQFLQASVVNELYLTISPLLFGSGLRLFNTQLNTQLELLESDRLGDHELLLHYRLKPEPTP